MIRAILFDFDGLTLDTEYPEFLSWKEMFALHGCPLAMETWVEHIGRGAGNISFSPYETLEAFLGKPLDRDAVRTMRRKRCAELMAEQELLPGVESLLREARESGLQSGLVTSSRREWIDGYLVRFGLTERFDLILCGDEVTNTKPDPELYLRALSAFDLGAEEALALEDSAHGITAAKQAEIFCVAVPNQVTRFSCLDHADLILDSLADTTLRELLLKVQYSPGL